jgi:hypothetical protein
MATQTPDHPLPIDSKQVDNSNDPDSTKENTKDTLSQISQSHTPNLDH